MAIPSNGYLPLLFVARKVFVVLFLQMTSSPPAAMAQYIGHDIGTIESVVGNTAVLRCVLYDIYPEYPVLWYHRDRQLYISYDANIYSNIAATTLRNRVSVECDRTFHDATCSLQITSLVAEDGGTYECGYEGWDRVYFLGSRVLVVSYGALPSEDSPICGVYDTLTPDGRYVSKSSKHYVNDEVYLGCWVEGSTLAPSLTWEVSDTVGRDPVLKSTVRAHSLYVPIILSANDIDLEFTCVMTHRTLDEERHCSVIPLPAFMVAPTLPETYVVSSTTTATLRTATINDTSRHSVSLSDKHSSGLSLPVIIIVVFPTVVILAVAALIVVSQRRRCTKNPRPFRPNYELTMDRDNCGSITAEYAVVHSPDSIDKADAASAAVADASGVHLFASSSRPSVATSSLHDHLLGSNCKLNNLNKPQNDYQLSASSAVTDHFAYYDNLHKKVPSVEDANGVKDLNRQVKEEDVLTYAELDLLPSPSSLMSPVNYRDSTGVNINKDATIYAEIEGTL